MKQDLAELQPVQLRDIWQHETQLTIWLANNIHRLCDLLQIKIDIDSIQTEYSVNNFRADIFAVTTKGRKVIIENQFKSTDHDHLGKAITYAAGSGASIVIWLVEEVREEHKQAIEWLNGNTLSGIDFFLITLEIWQIGNSAPAPKFHILVSPNLWLKNVRTNLAHSIVDPDSLSSVRLVFWQSFVKYLKKNHTTKYGHLKQPKSERFYDIKVGNSEWHIALILSSSKVCVQIYIRNNKKLYQFLLSHKLQIEEESHNKFEWNDNNEISSILEISKPVADIFDQMQYQQYFEWLNEKITQIQPVFIKFFDDFKQVKHDRWSQFWNEFKAYVVKNNGRQLGQTPSEKNDKYRLFIRKFCNFDSSLSCTEFRPDIQDLYIVLFISRENIECIFEIENKEANRKFIAYVEEQLKQTPVIKNNVVDFIVVSNFGNTCNLREIIDSGNWCNQKIEFKAQYFSWMKNQFENFEKLINELYSKFQQVGYK